MGPTRDRGGAALLLCPRDARSFSNNQTPDAGAARKWQAGRTLRIEGEAYRGLGPHSPGDFRPCWNRAPPQGGLRVFGRSALAAGWYGGWSNGPSPGCAARGSRWRVRSHGRRCLCHDERVRTLRRSSPQNRLWEQSLASCNLGRFRPGTGRLWHHPQRATGPPSRGCARRDRPPYFHATRRHHPMARVGAAYCPRRARASRFRRTPRLLRLDTAAKQGLKRCPTSFFMSSGPPGGGQFGLELCNPPPSSGPLRIVGARKPRSLTRCRSARASNGWPACSGRDRPRLLQPIDRIQQVAHLPSKRRRVPLGMAPPEESA